MHVPLHAQDKGQLREADCALRSTSVEREICLSKDLTRLDAMLNDHFAELRRKMTAKQFAPVQQKQRSWVLERDTCRATQPV